MAQPLNTAQYVPGPPRNHAEPGTFNPAGKDKIALPAMNVEFPLYTEPVDAANIKAMLLDVGRRTGYNGSLDGIFVVAVQGDDIGFIKL
jgi:hypothetical protein